MQAHTGALQQLATSTYQCNFDHIFASIPRPLILGRDFLIWNHVTVQYADDGKCILDYQQQELVALINIENKPQIILANSMTLPGRSLVVVCV